MSGSDEYFLAKARIRRVITTIQKAQNGDKEGLNDLKYDNASGLSDYDIKACCKVFSEGKDSISTQEAKELCDCLLRAKRSVL